MSILYRAMAIDCRNCDKRSEETISHVDKAMAGCSFYHIKSLDSNIAHSNKLNISLFLPKCLAILISPLAPSDWFSCFIFLMLCVNAMCDCRLMLPVLARSLEEMFNQWHILVSRRWLSNRWQMSASPEASRVGYVSARRHPSWI